MIVLEGIWCYVTGTFILLMLPIFAFLLYQAYSIILDELLRRFRR